MSHVKDKLPRGNLKLIRPNSFTDSSTVPLIIGSFINVIAAYGHSELVGVGLKATSNPLWSVWCEKPTYSIPQFGADHPKKTPAPPPLPVNTMFHVTKQHWPPTENVAKKRNLNFKRRLLVEWPEVMVCICSTLRPVTRTHATLGPKTTAAAVHCWTGTLCWPHVNTLLFRDFGGSWSDQQTGFNTALSH